MTTIATTIIGLCMENAITFNRPAAVQPGSPRARIMDQLEAAATAGDVAAMNTPFTQLLQMIPAGCPNGAAAVAELNELTDYLEQFETYFI